MMNNIKRTGRTQQAMWPATLLVVGFLLTQPNNALAQWAPNVNNIYNTNTGNVGIGTTAPEAPLTFAGGTGDKINFYHTGNNFKMQAGIEQYGSSFNMRFGMPSAYTDRIFQFGTISTSDGTTYNPLVTFQGGGNVGIGTTAPGAILEVSRANDSGKILRLGNLTVGFDFARSAATGALSIQGDQVGNNDIVLAPTSGKVGIGTPAPADPFDIKVAANTHI